MAEIAGDEAPTPPPPPPISGEVSRDPSSNVGSGWQCGTVTSADLVIGDEVFDELLHSALGSGRWDGSMVYTVVVVETDDAEGMRVVVGKHRHAWVVGKADEVKAVSVIGKVFAKYFMNGGIEEGEAGIGKGEFMPVGSDGNVVLSFSLLNADPSDWVYDWECPLYLQLPDGGLSKTNAFISPMWGGVLIWNPPDCSLGSKRTHGTWKKMSSQELMETLEIFIGQLRQLFGLKPSYLSQDMGVPTKFVVSEKGFTEWELDLLYRHHACSNLLSCLTTLESLSSLVCSLPRMIVMDEIGRQVELSLEAANLAQGMQL
ncbi:unnamed protein product [Miscanthus lutarioriparius]|uniref:Uncharacterized protein n=1 Tax=Miscanthus lutarioriparius TaxID=422564 RepID=A0A811SFQ3_9POAL|nr:unnamed protein product [Miscanthus lutarioriparius]